MDDDLASYLRLRKYRSEMLTNEGSGGAPGNTLEIVPKLKLRSPLCMFGEDWQFSHENANAVDAGCGVSTALIYLIEYRVYGNIWTRGRGAVKVMHLSVQSSRGRCLVTSLWEQHITAGLTARVDSAISPYRRVVSTRVIAQRSVLIVLGACSLSSPSGISIFGTFKLLETVSSSS
ncbi:hypothetical protein J6590_066443 [Homalodisca vitripennis]|nr:hypothetical protein J6590_066443 [Homalodisca vitripennis]